jgi:ABC-type transport system substrate-binding protein/class 3 adenylate cyclase
VSEPGGSTVDPVHTTGAELRTFLIADIRGYTKYTRERGDDAAAALATQFAALAEEAITAHEGVLVELRGDEALAVFVSARQALRAALAIQEAIAAEKLPRGVGIGLDAGEAVPVDGGYRGSALNLAARLCARAGPGEVVASDSVIHLAAHVDGIAYVDPRTVRVKGFSDAVRTVNVVAERDVRRGLRPSLGLATRRAFRADRRKVIIAAGAAIVTVAVVVGASGVLRRAPSTAIASPTPTATPDLLATANLPLLAFVDPTTGDVTATLPIAHPTAVSTFFDGAFWIVGSRPDALYEIDPTSHRVVQTINIGISQFVGGYAFADRTIWITDGSQPRVVAVDARTGTQVHDFRLIADPDDITGINAIAIGAGSIWAARPDVDEIIRADETTGVVQQRIQIHGAGEVAFHDGALWVTGGGTLSRIDPVTNDVTLAKDLAPPQWPQEFLPTIAWDGSAAWTANPAQGLVFRVARDGTTRTFQTGRGAGQLAFAAGVMWVANPGTGSITAIDVTTGETRTVTLGHAPGSMAAGEGQLMVAISATPEDEIAALPGQTLVVATTGNPLFDGHSDPAWNSSWDFRTLEVATCATLVRYPDKPGIEGLQPVPEVAADLPSVSSDGLTYTFKIRPGFAFSPPSNEPLTAETFRASIERALSGKLGDGTRGIQFLDHLVGAQDFHDGKADGVAGLTASGETLTIRLVEPDPVLLRKLTFPVFCPVPLGTPAVDGGVTPDPPLASAGPYYIVKNDEPAPPALNGLVILTRNPSYHGARPQTFQNIAVLTGLDAGDAIARVDRGDADVALAINDVNEALLDPGSEIDRKWGPGSPAAAAGTQRLFIGPIPGVDYLALDSRRGIFADPDIRRAVSLAIDRAAIASALPARSANDHLLPTPASYSGVLPSVRSPQPADAGALMAGRQGTAIFAVPHLDQCGVCTTIANTVKSNLAQIGITVKIEEEDDVTAAATAPTSKIDMAYFFSQGFYIVDPAGLLDLVVHEEVPSTWLPPEVSARVDEIIRETGAQRDADANAFAKRLDTDDLYVLPFGGVNATAYVSPRIDCAFFQPGWYKLDLAALCQR